MDDLILQHISLSRWQEAWHPYRRSTFSNDSCNKFSQADMFSYPNGLSTRQCIWINPKREATSFHIDSFSCCRKPSQELFISQSICQAGPDKWPPVNPINGSISFSNGTFIIQRTMTYKGWLIAPERTVYAACGFSWTIQYPTLQNLPASFELANCSETRMMYTLCCSQFLFSRF